MLQVRFDIGKAFEFSMHLESNTRKQADDTATPDETEYTAGAQKTASRNNQNSKL
jgi:hypothetical protein